MAGLRLSQLREFETRELKARLISDEVMTRKIREFFDVAGVISVRHIKRALVECGILVEPNAEGEWRVKKFAKQETDNDSVEELLEEVGE